MADGEQRRSWSERVLELSGSVYGTILASSILATLSYKEHGNAWIMIGALVAIELVFALSHAWSTLLADGRERSGLLPAAADVLRTLRYEWPALQATWPALIILLIAGLGLISVDAAVNAALVANAAILFVWGFALAHLHRAGSLASIAAGTASCLLGAALVALKLALH